MGLTGCVIILLHSFQWKSSCKSVLVKYLINMNSVCLKYANEGEVVMQYILIKSVVYRAVVVSSTPWRSIYAVSLLLYLHI